MENTALTGKTCLITGSSRGIGYETAAGLARLGAHVILVSHNQARIQSAQEKIASTSGQGSVHAYVADLSIQDEIKKLAAQIQKDYEVLDVLVNNVGGWYPKFQLTADGIEKTFALNHLSYFLLSGTLLPLLQKSAAGRIVNVSSDAHFQAKGIQFDDIHFKEQYSAFAVYAHSKLANVLFTYELARRLSDTAVTVNALHPGFVQSELYRHFGIITPLVKFFAGLVGKSASEGAETPIYLASSPNAAGITGQYFSNCKPKKSSTVSYDETQAKRLWSLSESMTGFTYHL